ncbi:MAG: ABC transporter ATP-binding protein [Lachnospiraceae bacterium]|nr:ABC transporter ATP-binding protein [Lachnospiraceae bacterium]MEE1014597.1 ABC transporter ATP-binding protein [Lachnospiraceae bacterium]
MEKKEYSMGELMKRFLPYYGKYKHILILDLICAGLTSICELVLPMIMRQLTNMAANNAAALTVQYVLQLGVLYLGLRMIDGAANFYMAGMGHIMGTYMETDMRRDAYAHLQKLSNTYYNNTKVGQIMGRITNDLFDVTEFAHHCPEEFFIAALKAVFSFIILLGVSPLLTLLIFICLPIMFLVCLKINRKQKAVFREQRHQIGELNARIEDSLLGQRVVKAFTNEEKEKQKFEEDNQKFLGIKKHSYHIMAAFSTTNRLFDGMMYLIVIAAGGIFLTKGLISAGDLVAYTMYVSTMIATIRRIIEFAEQFQRGITGIERFLEIMDSEIEIFDEPDAVEMPAPKGEIVFDNVSFEYSDDHNEVLRNISLRIHAGEKLALVGPSGGGKTTLCNLIPRFYDVTDGKILIDGEDIRKYTLKSLRGNIGVVQQDVYLFSGTIRENILYGKLDATEEEVIEAAKKAEAHEFIMNLKDGYDTYVGERGVKLSGGQKQRISIARVFLKNPAILILDEATSALDNESEAAIVKSLDKLSEGRTTLTIAHRLSSIQNSDRVLELTDDGIREKNELLTGR